MKIALFKNMEHGSEYVAGDHFESVKGYVRVSDYIEVEFSPLSDDRIVQQQIDALDQFANEATEQYRRTLAGILERKSRLLAITLQPGPRP